MKQSMIRDALWDFTVKYIFNDRAAVTGIAEATLREMAQEGHRFELRESETLDDKCLSVSLLKEPSCDVQLERLFRGVMVFYHICNGSEERRIYLPPE